MTSGITAVHLEVSRLWLRHSANLLKGGLESSREEGVPIAYGFPPFDDVETVGRAPGSMSEQSCRRGVVIDPPQLSPDGVIFVGPHSRELQDLRHCHFS